MHIIIPLLLSYLQCQRAISLLLPQNRSQTPGSSPTANSLDHTESIQSSHLLSTNIHVPNSEIFLRIQPQFPLLNLDFDDVRVLILLAIKDVDWTFAANPYINPESPVPPAYGSHHIQEFIYHTWGNVEVVVDSDPRINGGKVLAYGQLRDVLEGLRIFSYQSDKFFDSSFEFWNGAVKMNWRPLGYGTIRRRDVPRLSKIAEA